MNDARIAQKMSAEHTYGVATIAWQDYLELCKPKVVALMLLTSLVGMHLATPHLIAPSLVIFTMLGIGCGAASAAVINHLVDRRIDSLMARTARRPVATGRVAVWQAAIFAVVLGIISMLLLWVFVNKLTAALTLLTLIGYAGIYTLLLKRTTPQNIVIGGLAGAAPPLLGWVAVTGNIDPHSLLLVLIIFTWTPPHFWALAIHRYDDYAKANIPMLPVTHGIRFTKFCMVLYTILLLVTSLLPFITGMSGWLYALGATCLGLYFVFLTGRFWLDQENRLAMQTFKYSTIYLMSIFVLLLVDHYTISQISYIAQ